MIHLNKCEDCIYNRTVLSDKGKYKICSLSSAEAADCITDIEDRKVIQDVDELHHYLERLNGKAYEKDNTN